MASTLERLLSIQGKAEQQTIDGLMESPGEPQKAAEPANQGNIQPVEKPVEKSLSGAQKPHAKASPEMLEAWRVAYRVFTKYSPLLKNAASLDDENDEAARLTCAALKEIEGICSAGEDADIIAFGIIDMLGEVFNRAKGKHAH